MGTQFWWFFDVLIISAAGVILYSAAAKGVRRGLLRFFGLLFAVVIGFFGSHMLKEEVYSRLFYDRIQSALVYVLDDEEWDVFEASAEVLSMKAEEGEETQDAAALARIAKQQSEAPEPAFDEAYTDLICSVLEARVSRAQEPHSAETLAALCQKSPNTLKAILSALLEENYPLAAQQIEVTLYRPGYVSLVRMGLFLGICLVVVILCAIISSMTKHSDEKASERDQVAAIPMGIVEAACVLLMIVVATRFLVTITDGKMLVFDPETIAHTKIFRHLYDLMSLT